jgi:hypothetical protein
MPAITSEAAANLNAPNDAPEAVDNAPVAEATSAPVKKAAKKTPVKKAAAAKKTAKKTPAAPAAEKTAAKKAPAKKAAPKKETGGLRGPQVRILQLLAKSNKPITRSVIAEKAPVDVATCVEYIGSPDPEKRKKNDTKHFPSLVTLKLVSEQKQEIDGREKVVYQLTAAGKQKLEQIKAAGK